MNRKFKDRKEQRKVTETMNALLLPMLTYLNSDTAIIVKRALYLLGEIEIESQEERTVEQNDKRRNKCIKEIHIREKEYRKGKNKCTPA